MDGTAIDLRLWDRVDEDVEENNIYILRGLKVALEKYWDDSAFKFVTDPKGERVLDCTPRTAIEEVSHHEEIRKYFH